MKIRIFILAILVSLGINVYGQSSDTLNILFFGHSYGIDCTEHLPKLIDAAGIRTVRLARFYKGNCSLKDRYKFFVEDYSKGYTECEPGQTEWKGRPFTFKEAIDARRWDYIIFQNSLENEGRYETVQPYLDDMVSYIRKVSNEKFGSEPEICWNMFWPISDILSYTQSKMNYFRMSFYEHNSEKMFQAYMAATKQLMAETGITSIIPSGTAVMNLRESYLNTTQMQDFTRDGFHLSFGAGRYAAACVFFEYFIKQHYGISVLGNPLRLADDNQPVDDRNAEFIQQCAIAAVTSPFVINTELGPRRPEHRKLIGGLKSITRQDAGKLKFKKDFIEAYEQMHSLNLPLEEQLPKTNILECKRILRSIIKEFHCKKSPDVMSYGGQIMEQTYNSLRHIVSLEQFLDKPVKSIEISSENEDYSVYAFRDYESGIKSFVIWNDAKKPDKTELMGSISLTFSILPYSEPVCVDIRSGAIYSLIVNENTLMDIPYYDSPVLLTDRSMISDLIK